MAKQIQFIGAGKLGTTFARALYESGNSIPFFWTKQNNPFKSDVYLPKTVFRKFANFPEIELANVIIITVPDNQIYSVGKKLASAVSDWSQKIVLHTSGSLTIDELKNLKLKGANVGSIHPMQTFNSHFLKPKIFENIYFAIEGNEKILDFAKSMCELLKSKFIKIKSDQKILYHTAGVAASNFLTGLIHFSESLFKNLKIDKKDSKQILHPIIQNTLENYIQSDSISTLTGPLTRGDINVLKNQLSYLKNNYEELYPFYLEISKYIFRYMIDKNIPNYKQIEQVLKTNYD